MEDESFLALPVELGLVLAAGGPVEEQQTLCSEVRTVQALPSPPLQGAGVGAASA